MYRSTFVSLCVSMHKIQIYSIKMKMERSNSDLGRFFNIVQEQNEVFLSVDILDKE